MLLKHLLLNLGKLLLCGLAFSVGAVIGGMVATLLGLQPPQMPEGLDPAAALRNLLLTSPLLALALALVARGLGGGFLARAFTLSCLTWIAYTVNTQLEAMIFTSIGGGFGFTVIAFLAPSLLCGAAVAWLFPSAPKGEGRGAPWRSFFSQRAGWEWVWRLAVAAVAFMPIYYFFGLLVVPFTADYYRQSMYGLQMPGLDQILTTLFVRSLLFLLACLPVVVLWQKPRWQLFLSLGFALFVLVGLLYMLAADYMPWSVRIPHTLEILADEFVYAGALALLLARRSAIVAQPSPSVERSPAV
jgi:hypothetical protein